jgi:DNA repair exonuclease SbcCD ATPase subunit
MASELQSAAAALYAGRLEDFTAARDERSKAAKADGDKELAAAIGRLRKPTAAAWLVSMLLLHRPELVDEVAGLGAALRQAQQRLDGPEMRRLGRVRQEVIRRVGAEASTLAAELGSPSSTAVLEEVAHTFQAAATDAAAAAAVRSGLLTKALPTAVTSTDLRASLALPDLVDLEAAEPEAEPLQRAETQPVRKRPSKRDAERAQKQRDQAERTVQAARDALDEKTGLVEDGRTRRLELEHGIEDLQQQLDDAEDALADLEKNLRALEKERRAAQRELQDAERAVADLPD